MKKLIVGLSAAAILSTGAMAGTWMAGTVGYIQFTDTLAKVQLVTDSGPVVKDIDPQGAFFKEMVAALLTAKTQNGQVNLFDDAGMWTKIKFN